MKNKDTNTAVLSICDHLSGVMSVSGYKDYILVMLFVKYISDILKDRDKDDVRILPEDASFYDLYQKRNEANIGELINIALESIETSNKNKLEGVFRNIDFNSDTLGREKDRSIYLKMLLEKFNEIDMSTVSEDIIGNVYIHLSEVNSVTGVFYTPHMVSKLVARLCKPKVGARICDPTCGSGGLLIEAMKVVNDRDCSIYGMEAAGKAWVLCRMNMFLHGITSSRIEWCNTLREPALVENDRLMKFDNVVANPPFSLKGWQEGFEIDKKKNIIDPYERFKYGIPPKSKGDYAFISHMIESAVEKEGRVSVVVPLGILFRGAAEGRIRKSLIEDNLLDAVIGLPGNLFPSTSIPVAILIFDRSREKGGANEERKDVLFIDASKDYQPGKNQNTLLAEHMEKILDAYEKRENQEKYAYVADYNEIKNNDFNLNIPRYVDTFEKEEEIDIVAVNKELVEIEAKLKIARDKVNEHLKVLTGIDVNKLLLK